MNFKFQCKSKRLFSFVCYSKFFLQAPIHKTVFLEFNSLLYLFFLLYNRQLQSSGIILKICDFDHDDE